MTTLAMAQTCATRLKMASPSVLLTSTDNDVILLLAMINEAAQKLRDEFEWPELQKEYTFTLATDTASYALPGDINSVMMETLWNRSQNWPLIGPLGAMEWQQYKSGIIASFPMQRFRIKGWATNQFFIDPTPSSAENGETCVYEYISKSVFRPKTWVTATVFAANAYSSYNGNIYRTTAGGTTGATPPTHTSGSVSDGTVTWTYQTAAFETVIADTDESILDQNMVIDRACWRWKQENGLAFEDLRQEAEENKELSMSKLQGAGILSINTRSSSPQMLSILNYPEQGYLS